MTDFLLSSSFEDCHPGSIEDYFIRNFADEATGKFFFEAGAVNGFHMSQTATLERDLGWDGILVEAHLELFDLLDRGERKAKCVRSFLGYSNEVTFFEQKRSGLMGTSQIRETRKNSDCIVCRTKTVEEVLTENDAPDRIDFMVIDVEGAWRQVWQGIDFQRRHIDFLGIEMKTRDEKVISSMKAKGFELLAVQGGEDYLFKSK